MEDGVLLVVTTWRQAIVTILAVVPVAIHLFLQWKRGELAKDDGPYEDEPES